jgi:uncharacterized protein (TIGR00730 family)
VRQGHSLVYGGGNIGLMGVVADSVLAAGGKVTGVIPDFLLQREVGHTGLTELEVVATMHERKRRMADLADAFIAMPGGWGTLDELAEILTWRQLHLTHEPVGILNTDGFFDPLLLCFQQMNTADFLAPGNLDILRVAPTPEALLPLLFLR